MSLETLVAARDAERVAHEAFVASVLEARKDHTLQEIATALGVSRQRVHQILKAQTPADDEQERLEARLAVLDSRWEALVQSIMPMFVMEGEKLETLYRNRVNAKVRQSASGKTKAGHVKGSVGRFKRTIVTVNDERRALCEAQIAKLLLERSDDPTFVAIAAEVDEAYEIRVRLAELSDAKF